MSFLEKRKFVLIIGDDGAVLAFVNGKKLEKRLFSPTASLNDRRDFNTLFLQYPSVPVHVLLDTMEQSYTKQTLPAVSSLAIGKLVKKRLDRDFAASDIKGALLLGRDLEGRRDWMYMFASAPVTAEVAEWIDYIGTLENKVAGVYMLPVEMESFVKAFNQALAKLDGKTKEKKKEKAKEKLETVGAGQDLGSEQEKEKAPPKTTWQFVVTNNKTGGFRQVILQNGRVIFTRLIRPGKDSLPDIVAGNIEQEILNTIDYMRRLSFTDEDEVEVIAVLAKELKKSLQNSKVRGKEIKLYTPHEVAEILSMPDVAGPDDKFADMVFASSFARTSAVLKLDNPRLKSSNSLSAVGSMSTVGVVVFLPIFLLYAAYIGYDIFSVSQQVSQVEDDKANIEKKWRDARKSDEYNIDDANKITDVVTLHKELKKAKSPLDLVYLAAVVAKPSAMTRSLTWSFDKPEGAQDPNAPGVESAIFNLEFYNRGTSLDQLFTNFDKFKNDMKTSLKDYTVELTELPDTISFDNTVQALPVQVKITGMASNQAPNPDAEQ